MINIIINQGLGSLQPNYAFSAGSIFITISILCYFNEIVRTEEVMHLNKNLSVWLGVGLLLFHLISMPLSVIANSLPKLLPGDNSLLLIKFGANVAMYSIFILGFIWSIAKKSSI